MADADSPHAAGSNGPVAAPTPPVEERWYDRILSVFGLRPTESLRENLAQALVDDAAGPEAMFNPEERRLLQNILALRDVRILDVMVPRADIDAVAETITLGDLIKTFREAGHSRLPVYRETLDDPVGFVHAKDVMIRLAQEAMDGDGIRLGSVDLSRPLAEMTIVRPILFVPPSMPAMDLMVRMQANRIQLALVVDEYGGTDGLVSLEDLIETVVGDIEDEYDWPDEPTMIRGEDGSWLADARVAVDDFEEESGVAFPQADFMHEVDTLGGVVFALTGRVPVRGEIVTSEQLPGMEFEVLEADLRRIKRIKVTVRPVAALADPEAASP
ncbi:hemolysin family protein [Acuticoccus sp.]|uniref:hemolysin family protein n=1 Tax=Acuticoccus sp. TaxID=1904378 RepID=UPI003B5272FF